MTFPISTTLTTTSTTYTAGDVLGTASTGLLTFSLAGRAQRGGGVVLSVTVVSSILAATPAEMELWLFDATVAAIADSGAWAPTDAEAATCIGIVELASADAYAGTVNRTYHVNGLSIPYKTTQTADTKLYGYLVVRNAYTPGAAETLTIRLGVDADA